MENYKDVKFEFYGSKLAEFRKEKKISQEELAYEINVSRQSIYLWETGKSIPDVENIVRLCQILEISLSDLTKGLEKIDDISIRKKNKKVFTILLSVILIIFIVYVFISLRKFVIVSILNNKLNNYSDLDNYYCNKIYYEMDEESLKNKRYYEEKIYYKDGIYKNTYTNYEVNTEETEESIIWIDTVKNEGYIFDKSINNLRRFDFESEKVATNDGIISIAATNKIYRGKNELLVNFIYAFNPFFRISSSKNEYIIKYTTQILNYKEKIEEKIDKNTGLIKEVYKYGNDGICKITSLEIIIGKTSEENISKPVKD